MLHENGNKPTLEVIVIRTLCRFISFDAFLYLGIVLKGWHDNFSKTIVVDEIKYAKKKRLHEDFNSLGKTENEVVF